MPSSKESKAGIASYRDDPLYPRIVRAVGALLEKGRIVAPVDVLLGTELLSREDLERWRFGKAPVLERVIRCNLARLSRLLRILRLHAHDLNLGPSFTAYMRWGKGRRRDFDSPCPAIPGLRKPIPRTS